MPAIFSSLYGQAPNAQTPTFIYNGPQAERRGQSVLRWARYTGAIAFNANPVLNDVLHIAGGFLAGERIDRITNIRSADPDAGNDFTFNLGWRIGTAANPGTAFASASTGMQAVAAFEVASAAALAAQAAAEGDDLILTPTAGALEATTVTHTFIVESYIP